MKAIINACVMTPDGFVDGQSVLFENSHIVKVCCNADRPAGVPINCDLSGMKLVPGFVDVQVNGGGGVLFNDSPTVDAIAAIGEAHRQFGTTGFFPTLISDDQQVMKRAIRAVDEAIEAGVPGVLGIHLEGPFLNPEKSGVHDLSKFMRISADEVALMVSLRRGKTIVTLAPEMTTPDMIRALHQHGVIVSAGHTQASYEEARGALDAGLRGFTHLFNAMRPMSSRQPGIIAAALEDPRGWCGVIADGYHVHPAMLRLAMRAKSAEQIFLVTDAMPSVGAAHKAFSLGATDVAVADGKCMTGDGTLAGSDLDMISAVRNAMKFLGVDLSQAVRMASHVPARFVHLDHRLGQIRPGLQADFISLSARHEVINCWVKGEMMISQASKNAAAIA
ncbi:MAG: N-acetylglucosamine-6-phosphate deacetylase [Robiginitomaculum sp.]|nr:MAG: N-acetylglucosamine-6-phosphate deacetylase [Robiginitomaculum sp.]